MAGAGGPGQTPEAPTPSGQWVGAPPTGGSDRQLVVVLVVVIGVLAAVIAGGGLYLLGDRHGKHSTVNATATRSAADANSGRNTNTTSSGRRSGQELAVVPLQESPMYLHLESAKLGQNSVLMSFRVVNVCDRCESEYISFSKSDLKKAFLIDEAANKKYQVVIDANGEPLLSEVSGNLNRNGGYAFFIQFTAPPRGTVVNVVVPGAQPMVGITIN